MSNPDLCYCSVLTLQIRLLNLAGYIEEYDGNFVHVLSHAFGRCYGQVNLITILIRPIKKV